MEGFRTINKDGYRDLKIPRSFGRPATLAWMPIADLIVDCSYQRDIDIKGRANIRRIVEQFDWSLFSPVIIAAAGSGKYAVIDGQHRTTAAALCGLDRVPCAIIEMARAGQALAFKAINGNITRVNALQIFHASVAAGDKNCLVLIDACKEAGVTISRHSTVSSMLKVGETLAVETINRAINKFGKENVVTALRCIVESGGGNAGLLNRQIIWGCVEVLADHAEWHKPFSSLVAAFDAIDLDDIRREANAMAARTRGTSPIDQFEARLVEKLAPMLSRRKIA